MVLIATEAFLLLWSFAQTSLEGFTTVQPHWQRWQVFPFSFTMTAVKGKEQSGRLS